MNKKILSYKTGEEKAMAKLSKSKRDLKKKIVGEKKVTIRMLKKLISTIKKSGVYSSYRIARVENDMEIVDITSMSNPHVMHQATGRGTMTITMDTYSPPKRKRRLATFDKRIIQQELANQGRIKLL